MNHASWHFIKVLAADVFQQGIRAMNDRRSHHRAAFGKQEDIIFICTFPLKIDDRK